MADGEGASEEKRKPHVYGKACPSLADSKKRKKEIVVLLLLGKAEFLAEIPSFTYIPSRFTSTHLLKRLVAVSSTR